MSHPRSALVICLFLAHGELAHAGEAAGAYPSALAQAETGPRYALVIGVNEYVDGRVKDLKYAANDAYAVSEALLRSGDYQSEHIIVMTTKQLTPELQPTRANIIAQLQQLRTVVGAESLLVFFSGHGSGEVTQNRPENFLWTMDVNFDDLPGTALKVSDVQGAIFQMDGFKERAILMDACRSDTNEKSATRGLYRPDSLGQDFGGLQILYSAEFGTASWEVDDKQLGQFTWALVEGLAGEADGAGDERTAGVVDDRITMTELQLYSKAKLNSSQSSSANPAQRPFLDGEQSSAVVVAKRPQLPRHPSPAKPCPNNASAIERAVDGAISAFFTVPADEMLHRVYEARASWECSSGVVSADLVAKIHQVQMLRAFILHDESSVLAVGHTIRGMGKNPLEGVGLPSEHRKTLQRLLDGPSPDISRMIRLDPGDHYVDGRRTNDRVENLPAFVQQVNWTGRAVYSAWYPAGVTSVVQTLEAPALLKPVTVSLTAGLGVALLATAPFAYQYSQNMVAYRGTRSDIRDNMVSENTVEQLNLQQEAVNDSAKSLAIPAAIALGLGASLIVVQVKF